MNHAGYAAGVALVVLSVAAYAVAAVALRVRWLPEWSGAPARLVECVLGLAAVILANQVLGAVGAMHAATEVAVAAAAGIAGALGLRRRPSRGGGERRAAPPVDRLSIVLAAGACAVVAADWGIRVRAALAVGMPNVDTLWYHGPFAGRFAQDGSFHALAQTQPDPLTPFYPANAELLHAVGILLLGDDALSPMLNIGWLALALLAGWCIGRPAGVPAATLLAVAVVVGSYLMSYTQPGDASNDIVGLALFLASVALVLNARGDGRALALAALSAGLALGTKVSLLAPVLALFLALVAVPPTGERRRFAASWLVALPLGGGIWYLRNLIAAGSPLPWIKLGIGGVALPTIYASPELESPENGFGSTLAHLLGQSGGLDRVQDGFSFDLGPAWWAILAGAVIGLAIAAASRRDRAMRALGFAGIVSAVAYVFTPESGTSFIVNVRHATPALALGLALLPLAPALRAPARRRACLVLMAVLFVVTQLPGRIRPDHLHRAWLATLLAAAAAAALVVVVRRAGMRQRTLAGIAAGLVLATALAGHAVHEDYLRGRYADRDAPFLLARNPVRGLEQVYEWARDVSDETIGVSGTQLQYPLLGLDLSNRVRYLHHSRDHGRRVYRLPTCTRWRAAIAALQPRYVVVTPVRYPFSGSGSSVPIEARWTRALPGVRRLAVGGPRVQVFEVTRPLRPAACPPPP